MKALVRTSVLPEVAVPLQEEISEQWEQWEKEYEEGIYLRGWEIAWIPCYALLMYCCNWGAIFQGHAVTQLRTTRKII